MSLRRDLQANVFFKFLMQPKKANCKRTADSHGKAVVCLFLPSELEVDK